MKKISTFLLAGAAVFGLAACNNEKGNNPENILPEGSTYAGLRVSTTPAGLKADAGQKDQAGRAEEQAIATLDFISSNGNKAFAYDATSQTGDLPVDQAKFWKLADNSYIASPWTMAKGQVNFGLVLNKATVAGFTYSPVADLIMTAKASELSADGKFLMTSAVRGETLVDGVTADDIKGIKVENKDKNVFASNVERVVVQGIVVDGTTSKTTTDNTGDLSGLKFGGAMGAAKTYLYLNNAGDRQMTGQVYPNFKSAIHNVTVPPYSATNYGAMTGTYPNYTNTYLTANEDVRKNFAYAEKTNLELFKKDADFDAEGNAKKAGFYFLENSMAMPASHTEWAYTRNAYAKVYGTFKPAKIFGAKLVFIPQAGTGKYFDENTGETKNQAEGGKEGKVENRLYDATAGYTAGTDFFLGEKDGVFYLTSEAAKLSQTNPGQKSYKYTKGVCVYRTPWNRQMDTDKTKNANARRNNIYLLTINSFKTVGLNYDPNDPNDPNAPYPENPDEPTTPPDGGDPKIDDVPTYMNVIATVLQWNQVSRGVDLGK